MESKRCRITTGGGQKLTFVSYEKAKEYWDQYKQELQLARFENTRGG